MNKSKDAPSAPPAKVIPPPSGEDKPKKAKGLLGMLGFASEKEERDKEVDSLMSEIEAGVREDEIKRLWKTYGKLVYVGAAAIVLSVASVELWRAHEENKRLELVVEFEQALAARKSGETDKALEQFADMANQSGKGYAAIAQLERAGIFIRQGDVDAALTTYETLAGDSAADPIFRDLALLLQVMHSIDSVPANELEIKLAPLLNPGNAFNPSALELSAILAAKQGDVARALRLAEQLVEEPRTPPGMLNRAKDLVAYYKAQFAAETQPPKS